MSRILIFFAMGCFSILRGKKIKTKNKFFATKVVNVTQKHGPNLIKLLGAYLGT